MKHKLLILILLSNRRITGGVRKQFCDTNPNAELLGGIPLAIQKKLVT